MATTAGSFALLNSIPVTDAPVIAKLRAAGAIILGKTTMTELGNLKSSVEKMGRSARGGQAQSAYVEGGYNAGGDPLGSSSGSAIALSAGWAPCALGAEMSGSLVAPSGRAAVYCLRPTMGLVSREGTVPGARSMDTVGPMAKTAYDVALLLQHIAGTDLKDAASECGEDDELV
jgi:amidase